MKTKTQNLILQNKNILLIALTTGLILLLPWLAMQFTDQVAWGPGDFILAGVLLFGAGLAFELATRRTRAAAYRFAVGGVLAAALMLVWANLAVGIIGSEDNPANLMYIGVLAVLVTGVLLARLRPGGMARALSATALAQALVAAAALVLVKNPDVLEIVILNGFFIALWAGSAVMFRRAGAALSRTGRY